MKYDANTSAIEFYRSVGMTTKSRKMEIIIVGKILC